MTIFLVSQFSLFVSVMYAANTVKLTISDGIENAAIKAKMENTVSAILTEANDAQEAGRQMHYSQLGISQSVQGSLAALWENSPFVCLDDEIVEHCLTTGTGYQIRNIPLMLKPTDPKDVDEAEDYQEAVVSFDKQGNLTSFYLSISMNLYMNVVRDNKEITDLRRRQLILDYVEQFRTSYNQKDIDFLEAVFSDDALIITGKVIQRKTGDGIRLPDKIEYKKQSKQQYLTNLRAAFNRGKKIHVTFDEIEVMRHGINPDIYGVTLHQGWTQVGYHDDGYVFLLWDFRDESHPQIHVRTWQPDAYNSDGKGTQRIPKDEIFSLSDFDI
ncbi:MAG: nuclear transport factor 2 family protein [Bacteroidaceae bacterium]|nr:nuclear transport factor 2 family protein [Bacteroidaceae bacterium]